GLVVHHHRERVRDGLLLAVVEEVGGAGLFVGHGIFSHRGDCQAAETYVTSFCRGNSHGDAPMAQLFITDLDDAAEERLKVRARRHGHSLEDEARAILEGAAHEEAPGLREEGATLRHADEKGFGDLMYERFKDIGLRPDEVGRFNRGIAEFNSRWE